MKKQPKCGECGGDTSKSGYSHDGKDIECGVCGMSLCDYCAGNIHEKKRGHDPEDCAPPAKVKG